MGGYGSGRWGLHTKKDTVEDCRFLDTNRWGREGILGEGLRRYGCWTWWNARTGEQTSSIDYEVDTTDMACPWVRLSYTVTASQAKIDYRIRLQTTHLHFGGTRWWFTCPLVVHGRVCARRVGKLYLPPGGRYFACRRCYELTYTSCQESDKRVSFLRRNPEAFMALFAGDVKKTAHLAPAPRAQSPEKGRASDAGQPGRN
jgi:hypothetical protein